MRRGTSTTSYLCQSVVPWMRLFIILSNPRAFSIFWTINTHPQTCPYFSSLGLDHGSKTHAFVAVSISLEHLHERSKAFEFFYDGLNVATVLPLVGSRWIKACLIVLRMATSQKPTFHSFPLR